MYTKSLTQSEIDMQVADLYAQVSLAKMEFEANKPHNTISVLENQISHLLSLKENVR